MPHRRRNRPTPWKAAVHHSELLPAIRKAYAEFRERSKLESPWYQLARDAEVNPQTAQRILGCTRVRNPNTGRTFAAAEALARAMGYRIELVRIAP